jgi:hypothetical protein
LTVRRAKKVTPWELGGYKSSAVRAGVEHGGELYPPSLKKREKRNKKDNMKKEKILKRVSKKMKT